MLGKLCDEWRYQTLMQSSSSRHNIAFLWEIDLHPINNILVKRYRRPFINHHCILWSIILPKFWEILKSIVQHLVVNPRKYSTCVKLSPVLWSFTNRICKIRKVSCSSPLSDKYFCRVPLSFPFQIQIDRDSHNMSCLNRKQAHNQNLKS